MSRKRSGTTFVELAVAAGLFTLVFAVAWFFFRTARLQDEQVTRYASVLQAASSVGARLQMDLSAAFVPPGDPRVSDLFHVGADGRSLGFTRSPPVVDVEDPRAQSEGRRWLEYTTEPGPGGTFVLVRTLGDQVTRWASAPCREVHFALERVNGRSFVVAELLLVDEATAAGTGASNRRPFALRVVRRLRDPANFAGIQGHLNAFPAGLLGPLPNSDEVATELPMQPDPESPPPPLTSPGSVGWELGS